MANKAIYAKTPSTKLREQYDIESKWLGGVSSISGTTLGVSGAFPTSFITLDYTNKSHFCPFLTKST